MRSEESKARPSAGHSSGPWLCSEDPILQTGPGHLPLTSASPLRGPTKPAIGQCVSSQPIFVCGDWASSTEGLWPSRVSGEWHYQCTLPFHQVHILRAVGLFWLLVWETCWSLTSNIDVLCLIPSPVWFCCRYSQRLLLGPVIYLISPHPSNHLFW